MRIVLSRLALGIGILATAGTVAACSSSGSSGPGSSGPVSSPAGTPSVASSEPATSPSASTGSSDYSKLLISASDIPIAGFTAGTPAATPQGNGVAVAFTGAQSRTIGDTIIVLGSSSQATTAASASVSAAKQQLSSPEVTTAPIGDGGTALRGTASGQEVAILIWRSGRAVVVMEFQSTAGDPVPTSVIQAVATKQQALVKAGVPA